MAGATVAIAGAALSVIGGMFGAGAAKKREYLNLIDIYIIKTLTINICMYYRINK